MAICLLKNITKSYELGGESVEVLKDINLQIETGDFLAIMGPSGSGKTTLMNIIGCLDVPSAGEYYLAGKEVSHLSDDELSLLRNEHIGFIFQSFYLLPYATVLENVLLPTLYVANGSNREATEGALRLLKLVGLEDRAKFKPNQLSGGQQQRVAIARALVNDAELILADEPTGQLDSKTSGEIMELLAAMNGHGKTVVLITHDRITASYAKRVVHISDGRLKLEENAQDIQDRGAVI
ncbi:ABC transporter ATP-binding protein [Desulfoferrobacter suflitae]|uniref:ABC transporter ATP-binding protein n=1 Tax=Desulfoferrobacter suflitae TaxID=2865782 RepID=UPI002164B339|nr:ABC transporter ATP-binding protein [Desulfoferrobacter suflitae]MCK8603044.1 ABC transporter ATP-binding protein [Desulfoferrobacter suflitae]